jgi:hypothetical protein
MEETNMMNDEPKASGGNLHDLLNFPAGTDVWWQFCPKHLEGTCMISWTSLQELMDGDSSTNSGWLFGYSKTLYQMLKLFISNFEYEMVKMILVKNLLRSEEKDCGLL